MSTSPRRQAATASTTSPFDPDLASRVMVYYRTHHLLEDLDVAAIEGTTHRLFDVLRSRGVGTVDEALADHKSILKAAADVKSFSRAMHREDCERLHHVRNTLAALLATANAHETTPAAPPTLLEPPARPGGRLRALTDDEILVMRLATLAYARTGGRHHTPAVSYVLAESGAYPSETTVVTPADLDNPRTPTAADLPGVTKRAAARTVRVPKWGTPILSAALDVHLARSEHAHKMPIAYDGRAAAGGNTASASASANLKRLMKNAGLTDSHLAPTSVTRWRVNATLKAEGIQAARDLLGSKGYDAVYEFIGILPEPIRKTAPANRRGFLAA